MGTEEWSLVVAGLSWLTAGWAVTYSRAQVRTAQGQLELARKVQREKNEPYVLVDIQPSALGSFLLNLIVENIGPTVARDVRISVTPELSSSASDEITQSLQRVLARKIPALPPGRRLEYVFDTGHRFQSDLPMTFDFTVNATGPSGPVETLQYTVDITVIAEMHLGERPTKQLEDRIKKVGEQLGKLTASYKEANQLAITETRRQQREAAEQRMRAQRQTPEGESDT